MGALRLHDGQALSRSRDHTLCLWSREGQPLVALVVHAAEVWGAQQLHDGQLLFWSGDHAFLPLSPEGDKADA